MKVEDKASYEPERLVGSTCPAKNRVGRNDRLGRGRGRETEKLQAENDDKGRRERAAKDRVGRNDRLSQGWSGEKEARDRVGRNDRLGQGRWGKVEAVEVKERREAAKNRVGRNDRLGRGNEEGKSPVGQEVESKQAGVPLAEAG